MSVAYFARPGLPTQLRGISLEYFFSALEILRDELPSPAVPLVVLGMSRGSEAAMLTAIHAGHRVRGVTGSIGVIGVVATVPGNVVAGSWPPGGPAWLTVLEYPEAGHALGYLLPRLPAGLLPPDLIDEAPDQTARADVWPRVVGFTRRLGHSGVTSSWIENPLITGVTIHNDARPS